MGHGMGSSHSEESACWLWPCSMGLGLGCGTGCRGNVVHECTAGSGAHGTGSGHSMGSICRLQLCGVQRGPGVWHRVHNGGGGEHGMGSGHGTGSACQLWLHGLQHGPVVWQKAHGGGMACSSKEPRGERAWGTHPTPQLGSTAGRHCLPAPPCPLPSWQPVTANPHGALWALQPVGTPQGDMVHNHRVVTGS